ncbi:Coatomer subunit alpha-1 [Picochlorum sp. SENEW3]|nr:Coatomer subunit alpha-1 [Picochlorum sp. SENEW3]WPT18342.1 Coatomer subunit alpha-1 [Picochlorum sp. SENEW3]
MMPTTVSQRPSVAKTGISSSTTTRHVCRNLCGHGRPNTTIALSIGHDRDGLKFSDGTLGSKLAKASITAAALLAIQFSTTGAEALARWDGSSAAIGSCPLGEAGEECRKGELAQDAMLNYSQVSGKDANSTKVGGKATGVPVSDMSTSAYAKDTKALASAIESYVSLDPYDEQRVELVKMLKKEGLEWVSKYARGGSARKVSARTFYIAIDAIQGHVASNGYAPFPRSKATKVLADVNKAMDLLDDIERNMLTKFETKSNRVKGLSFHPKRPWILASLHSGVVQLWDYRMGTLIDRFDEHEGPVRGVDFHPSQPLFVSGGDDYKIKVWNYKQRRCLFTLLGHLDYIRTVQFHSESPWIVSASDDQTIRVWNWQSRTCAAVLTGHNHYVMCAQFHPKEDLVVSASLDQTVRVWDISALRKKNVTPGMGPRDELSMRAAQANAELFGSGDAVVKYVLEGHDRGVNWASFHPSLPLIVSGADDRQVKLWRMNDTKAWEVDTLRGHVNNVSSVLFHPKQDLIISDSEDKSLRVWDMSKRVGVQTFRREHDRFWILAAHPNINLLAAGHDSGMVVFKLERERPAFASHGTTLFYIKDRYIRSYDFATGRDAPLTALRRNPAALYNQGARSMSYNPAENSALVQSDAEGGTWELYPLPKDGSSVRDTGDVKRGDGSSTVFIARNRFASFDKSSNTIVVRDLRGDITKKVASPLPATEGIFYAGTGMLLLRSEEKVALFDVQQRNVAADISAPMVKYVVWSGDMERVALLSKHSIVIADRKFQNTVTIHETIRIKSAAWDDAGVLVYTTLNHIKYCLPSGDSGVVRTLESPVYLTKVHNDMVYCLDREAKPRVVQINSAEYKFKLALSEKKYDVVLGMIRAGKLCGEAIIAFLQEKGYPEVALHFVKDERMRFNLAIECGNIEVALESAQALDTRVMWQRLGTEALRQGNFKIVEFAYQKTKDYERLSFLYAITGDTDKLAKMGKIAEVRGDIASAFHNALYIGDAKERVRILREGGQPSLAYLTACTNGLAEEVAELEAEIGEENLPSLPNPAHVKQLRIPVPITKEANWPLLTVSKGFFESLATKDAEKAKGVAQAAAAVADEVDLSAVADAWGDEDDVLAIGDGVEEEGEGDMGLGEEGSDGWEMEDLDLPPEALAAADDIGLDGTGEEFVSPNPGPTMANQWSTNCHLPAEQVAAGAFDTAMRLLQRQAGISRFEPMKKHFLDVFRCSHGCQPGLSGLPSMTIPLNRGWDPEVDAQNLCAPALPLSLPLQEERLVKSYRLVTEGKFADALSSFDEILHSIPLLVVDSRKEADEVKELLSIARDYNIALRVELKRREVKSEPSRAAELAAYFTHCNLQRVHAALSLRSAMTTFFKLKNYNSCATFCRRLLELQPDEKMATQARQVLAACEKNPVDEVQLDYDPRNPFDICSVTFSPIYKGNAFVEDPYTKAKFKPECEGQVSPVGNVAVIGDQSSGLVLCKAQLK